MFAIQLCVPQLTQRMWNQDANGFLECTKYGALVHAPMQVLVPGALTVYAHMSVPTLKCLAGNIIGRS